jgi:hypothetical protein
MKLDHSVLSLTDRPVGSINVADRLAIGLARHMEGLPRSGGPGVRAGGLVGTNRLVSKGVPWCAFAKVHGGVTCYYF